MHLDIPMNLSETKFNLKKDIIYKYDIKTHPDILTNLSEIKANLKKRKKTFKIINDDIFGSIVFITHFDFYLLPA